MVQAPTWIDIALSGEWHNGQSARYDKTGRWFVFLHESCCAFVVQSGNAERSSFGGDDTPYAAEDIASAIERWAMPTAGLEPCREFIDALQRHARNAEAQGTPLAIVRARYLLDAMTARAAIAEAEDMPAFVGYAQPEPADEADTETQIIPWELGHDG